MPSPPGGCGQRVEGGGYVFSPPPLHQRAGGSDGRADEIGDGGAYERTFGMIDYGIDPVQRDQFGHEDCNDDRTTQRHQPLSARKPPDQHGQHDCPGGSQHGCACKQAKLQRGLDGYIGMAAQQRVADPGVKRIAKPQIAVDQGGGIE
jgi:hypothetical protein